MHTTPRRPAALAVTALCTAVLLTLSACGNDNGPKEPTDPTSVQEVTTDPEPEPDPADDTDVFPADPDPADDTDVIPADPDSQYSPDEPPADPNGGTEPCAFSGDPLCPHNPVVVPAPNLDPW